MDQLQAARVLYTNNFSAFVKWAWKYVSPYPLVWGRHLDALCEHLQAIRDGRITNLLVNLPPRHSKSILCTVLFPVWMWLADPSEAILSASYGKGLATKHSTKSRRLVESDEFKRIFPWVQLTDGSNAQADFQTTAGGGFKAVSVGAATTGFDATLIIVDDLHSIKKKESEAERESALEYYRNDLSSRGVLGRKIRSVVIGQRVHAGDVSGTIIDEYQDDPEWTFLVLPLEYDPDRETLPNALGWEDWRSEPGEILFPEAVTPAMVAGFKKKSRHSYQCMYNQDVVTAAGELFKKEWFREYRTVNGNYVLGERVVRPESCTRVASVDIAVSTGSGNDWTVVVVADLIGGEIVVRHLHRERLDGVRFGRVVKGIYDTYRPAVIAVEQAGQQKIYVDQLRAAGIPVRAVKVTTDKVDRSVNLQVRFEAGQVWLPAGGGFVPELMSELLAFPRGRYDDQVDALGMIAGMGRYAARVQPTEDEREKQAEAAQERWRREMLMAGIE